MSNKQRLLALERQAARVITGAEFVRFLQTLFSIADATVASAGAVAAFREGAIKVVSRELAIDAEELRQVLL